MIILQGFQGLKDLHF